MNNFHMVDESPWPIMASFLLANFIISMFSFMNFFSYWMLFMGSLMPFLVLFFLWMRDIVRESTFMGAHSLLTVSSLKTGFILFIVSEMMFFVSFFWTFFHSSLNPALEIGNVWPSWSIEAINPFFIPLLNTLILVSSGVSITYSHHMIMNSNSSFSKIWTLVTILLGVYFSVLQYLEYYYCTFTIMDSVYGSIFFMSTGFHGAHVIVGTFLIMSSFKRLNSSHFSKSRHLLFEFSCWYWHFVDLIWLFLFTFIYWWGF